MAMESSYFYFYFLKKKKEKKNGKWGLNLNIFQLSEHLEQKKQVNICS